jgi:hypothetical protein
MSRTTDRPDDSTDANAPHNSASGQAGDLANSYVMDDLKRFYNHFANDKAGHCGRQNG